MNNSDFYEVKDIYHFAIKNQFKIKEYNKTKFNLHKMSDKELIYQSINLILIKINKKEALKILGEDAYNDYLKLNKPAELEDIKDNLEVFDDVMFKYKDASILEKLSFLEKIVGDKRDDIIIPFVSAKLRKKYFSGKEAKDKMSFYRNFVYNLN